MGSTCQTDRPTSPPLPKRCWRPRRPPARMPPTRLPVDGTSLSVDVLNGRLEQAERAEGVEIGLRVMVGRRQACVSASDIRPETLREMAERAVGMARLAPEDATVGLADPEALGTLRDASGLDLSDSAEDPAPQALEESALRAEAAALAVKGISQVQSASAGFSRRRIHLAATNGFFGWLRTQQPRPVLRGHHRRGAGDGAGLFRGQPHPCRRPDRRRRGRTHRRRTHGRTGRGAQTADRRLSGRVSRAHCLQPDRAPPVRHQRQRHRARRLLGARPAGRGHSAQWPDPYRRAPAPPRRRLPPVRCGGVGDLPSRHRGRWRADGLDPRSGHGAETGPEFDRQRRALAPAGRHRPRSATSP